MKFYLTLICVLLGVGSVYATGQIDIAYSPYTISQSGAYQVVKDLHTPANLNCLTITTSNVSIDLNGHTLYGAGTSAGFGIISWGANNLNITNGTICDFTNAGIYLYGGDNIQITHTNIYNNGVRGVSTYGGIYMDYPDNALISDCLVSYNYPYGIKTWFASIITNCVINKNQTGIYATNGCTVKGNNIFENSVTGIYALYNNNVLENTITYQWDSSISTGIIAGGYGNRIDSNHITNNQYGIVFNNARNWYGRNTFYSNATTISGTPVAESTIDAFKNQTF